MQQDSILSYEDLYNTLQSADQSSFLHHSKHSKPQSTNQFDVPLAYKNTPPQLSELEELAQSLRQNKIKPKIQSISEHSDEDIDSFAFRKKRNLNINPQKPALLQKNAFDIPYTKRIKQNTPIKQTKQINQKQYQDKPKMKQKQTINEDEQELDVQKITSPLIRVPRKFKKPLKHDSTLFNAVELPQESFIEQLALSTAKSPKQFVFQQKVKQSAQLNSVHEKQHKKQENIEIHSCTVNKPKSKTQTYSSKQNIEDSEPSVEIFTENDALVHSCSKTITKTKAKQYSKTNQSYSEQDTKDVSKISQNDEQNQIIQISLKRSQKKTVSKQQSESLDQSSSSEQNTKRTIPRNYTQQSNEKYEFEVQEQTIKRSQKIKQCKQYTDSESSESNQIQISRNQKSKTNQKQLNSQSTKNIKQNTQSNNQIIRSTGQIQNQNETQIIQIKSETAKNISEQFYRDVYDEDKYSKPCILNMETVNNQTDITMKNKDIPVFKRQLIPKHTSNQNIKVIDEIHEVRPQIHKRKYLQEESDQYIDINRIRGGY
ncbi:Hypothetical_protein [Hexamita inflata]|uniref:Hypothetical_protein n=1 Tax=Hexamita inflata TaxID=28002 RepID=A0AA86NCJ8_9EUKA|nr:Hypothetical protein HINF_LOCUS4296 [Hexamita inflata]